MKNFIIALMCCLSATSVFGQFQHSYGTEKNDIGESLDALYDSDARYIVAGRSDGLYFGGVDASLTKVQASGAQVWSAVYGWDNTDLFNSVRRGAFLQDQVAYVAAGYTNSVGFGNADAWILGANRNGAPSFSHLYGGKGTDIFHDIKNSYKKSLGQDGYVAVGQTNSYTNFFPGNSMYVVKTDVFGVLTRATVIGGQGGQTGYWIEQTKDGGYIIVGSSFNNQCHSGVFLKRHQDILVVRLREDLTMMWSFTYGYSGPAKPLSTRSIGRCVKEDAEGNFYITGETNAFGLNNTYDAFLMILDRFGSFRLMKTYGTECDNEFGKSLLLGKNNAGKEVVTVVGSNNPLSQPNYDALMFQTDRSLNLVWAKEYGRDSDDTGAELTTYADKTYAFTGYTYSLGVGGPDIYLTETDLDGKSGTSCERRVELKEIYHQPCQVRNVEQVFVDDWQRVQGPYERFLYAEDRCTTTLKAGEAEDDGTSKLFPNPTNDVLTLEVPKGYDAASMKVIKLETGKEIMIDYESTDEDHVKLETTTLEKGVYILEMTTEDGKVFRQRFIKE
ncbi:T9SS type A sorting domain-containing protein [Fulvivirga ligni]|uniref:T9SS type A sorting domain-containing protein n=1 Tax=Fulvivirga ligni TaxID=2904246 RepID=UPI001F21830C|nr:T9SS type A sorting domain-containing protein [Fulvivirga ligni]UII23617.1 T9SS type A sorting domain-containing protein [Fulvivirga ligni]